MNIKELRAKKNYTQTDLAQILGKHLNTIQKWESGKTSIPDKMLPKLAEIFGLDMQEIVQLKYDFNTDSNPNPAVAEDVVTYASKPKLKNEYSGISRHELELFLRTEKEMLAKTNIAINKLVSNGNDIESLRLLKEYQEFKKEILKTIADIEVNL